MQRMEDAKNKYLKRKHPGSNKNEENTNPLNDEINPAKDVH